MKGYQRITEKRETPLVMSQWSGDSYSLKIYNRLAELEDKIEAGTLVEVPQGAVVLTPEEREEEMRLCNDELVGEVYCVRHGKRLEQIEEEKGE